MLTTDASQVAAGAVLSQETDRGNQPVAYASFKFTPAETRYSAIERELLAVVKGTEHFRPYLWGKKFVIRTDHKPLLWTNNLRENSARITRFKEKLALYDFEVAHIKGVENVVADWLSRHVNVIEGQNVSPQPWQIIDDIINNKSNQVLFESDNNDGIRTELNRYGPLRIITVLIGPNTGDEEVERELKEVLDKDRSYHVNFSSQELRNLVEKLYKANRFEGISLTECTKKIQTIRDPREQQELVLNYHVGKTNHRGVNETYMHLGRRYYWVGMFRIIREQLSKCEICARTKYERHPREAPQQITATATRNLERVFADIFVFEAIKYLTLIDEASRAVSALRVRSKSAEAVRKALLHYFSTIGCPEQLVLDKGREFNNRCIRETLEQLGVRIHYTTPGHPRSHGLIERVHGTLIEHLHLLQLEKGIKGEEAMSRAVLAYNSSIHTATRRTPHEALTNTGPSIGNEEEYYEQCKSRKERRVLKGNLKNKVERACHIRPGMLVFRKNACKRRKEDLRYLGPYRVLNLLSRHRVELCLRQDNGKRYIVHRNELRLML